MKKSIIFIICSIINSYCLSDTLAIKSIKQDSSKYVKPLEPKNDQKIKDPTILANAKQTSKMNSTNEDMPISTIQSSTFKFIENSGKIMLDMIKKTINLTIKRKAHITSNVTVTDYIGKSLKYLLLQMSNIPQTLSAPNQPNPLKKFKAQITYLVGKINLYNSQNSYISPTAMLQLIEYSNRFIKESNDTRLSSDMIKNMSHGYQVATECCAIFNNKNIIYSSFNAPTNILDFFLPVINATNQLSNTPQHMQLMQAIYQDHGYINQIITQWHHFNAINPHAQTVDKHYAAFITFLLLFEQTLVADAIIIDATSILYKVTNPIAVTINIA